MTSNSPSELPRITELSLTRPDSTIKIVEDFCRSAREQKLYGVCLYSSRVELATSLLAETDLRLTALIGGFIGNADSDVKRYETEVAIDYGAQEIEFDLNIGRLKDGDSKYVLRELRDVVEAADERTVKVGLHTLFLTREEILLACELILDSGAHFISSRFKDVDEIKSCREVLGDKFGIKAIDPALDTSVAAALVGAGATRLGTFSPV